MREAQFLRLPVVTTADLTLIIDWFKKMRQTHGLATLAALGTTISLLVSAPFYLFANLYAQHAQLTGEALRHASSRGTQLELMMERAMMVPSIAVNSTSLTGARRLLQMNVRNALRLSGIVSSLDIQLENQEKFSIQRNPSTQIPLTSIQAKTSYSSQPLTVTGLPTVSVEKDEILIAQTIAPGKEGLGLEHWGHTTAHVPVSLLVHELQLPALVQDGFAVAFSLHRGPDDAVSVLYADGHERMGRREGAVHSVYLPYGGSLRLTVAPPARVPLPAPLMGAGIALCSLLLLFLTLRLLRLPAELQTEVSLRNRQLDREKALLEQEIVARIKAEEHLEKSHALLNTVLDNLPGMVVLKRADDLRIMRVNRTAEQILGRSRDFLIGRSNEELYAPEFAYSMTTTDRSVLESQTPVELPLERLVIPGQEDRWILYRKIAVHDSKDTHDYVLEFGEDFTDRKLLDEKLRESLNFLEQLLDAMPGPMFYKDRDSHYLGVNTAFERLMGKSRREIVGKTAYDIMPLGLAQKHDEVDQELFAQGGIRIYEANITDGDSNLVTGMFHKALFFDTTGNPGGVVGVMLDITARKRDEARINQLNRILTVLSETNELIVHVHDEDSLLNQVCAVLREKGHFALNWIHIDRDGGAHVFADPSTIDIAERMTTAIRNPNRRCAPNARLCCPRIDCCDVAFAADQTEFNHKALVHLPLIVDGAIVGGIGILGTEEQLFAADEQRLLEHMANNVCFALEALSRERSRQAAEEKLLLTARVFDNNTEGIIVTDAKNRILMVNRAFATVTGYSAADVIGKNPAMLGSGTQDPEFYREMWHGLQHNGEWRGEVVNRRKNGELYPEWLTISLVRNEAGETTNFVAVFSDLTARKQTEERLNFLAHYDELTRLPNRILFHSRVDQALKTAQRNGQRLALLLFDLDRFKLVNETVGHAGGDRLLQEISSRLLASVGESCCVSRLGGDQFAVLAQPLTSVNEAAALADTLQQAILQSFEIQGHEIHIATSVGISVFPEDGQDADTLSKNADSAMYQAIQDGGNTFRFFSQEMNERSLERVRMEGKLHHALSRNEMDVHFQPFVCAHSGRIVGAEALLRWNCPELGGAISPGTFVPLLEDTGLILKVGEWVMERACAAVKRWRAQTGEPLFVAINLSAMQLVDPELRDKVAHLLQTLELAPSALEIELTESAVMRDASRGIALMRQLKELGVHLSVDDFGTGYSSLSYLKQLPIGTLKIDRSFVMDIPEDGEAASIARAIIAMGHSLSLKIIAEGVETAAQANFLRESGVDIFQGFYYSRPLKSDDMSALLATRPQFAFPAE